ncbi:MAG TPA: PH domain-containing protein [Mycobacteriales bacterium]
MTRRRYADGPTVRAFGFVAVTPCALTALSAWVLTEWHPLVRLAVVAVAVVVFWRAVSMYVIEDDEGLEVRGFFSTRRLRWSEIERFDWVCTPLLRSQSNDVIVPAAVSPVGRVVLHVMPVARLWCRQRYRDDPFTTDGPFADVVARWERERLGHRPH